MKKLLGILLVVGMFSFVACGPTAEEQAEKAKQDSIALADSLTKVQFIADSIAKIDSIATADSIAKAAKPVK